MSKKYPIPSFTGGEIPDSTFNLMINSTSSDGKKEVVDWSKQLARLPEVWGETKGKDIKVAILDTGIIEHPDFKGAVKGYENFTSEPDITDNHNHGTLIAGIIGARANSVGVIGVAPECDLYIGKVVDNSGVFLPEELKEGLEWALEQDVDVVSVSMGMPDYDQGIHDAIKDLTAAGKYVICAAGNDGVLSFPANVPETLAIGSINRHLISRSGLLGSKLDFVAPGVGIYSINSFGRLHYIRSGTSFSAPFVAGITALILSKHRASANRTPVNNIDQLRVHLTKMSMDLGIPGRDYYYGLGLPINWLFNIDTGFISQLEPSDLSEKGSKKLLKYLSQNHKL